MLFALLGWVTRRDAKTPEEVTVRFRYRSVSWRCTICTLSHYMEESITSLTWNNFKKSIVLGAFQRFHQIFCSFPAGQFSQQTFQIVIWKSTKFNENLWSIFYKTKKKEKISEGANALNRLWPKSIYRVIHLKLFRKRNFEKPTK